MTFGTCSFWSTFGSLPSGMVVATGWDGVIAGDGDAFSIFLIFCWWYTCLSLSISLFNASWWAASVHENKKKKFKSINELSHVAAT